MKYEKVHSIYKRCIDLTDIDPTLVSMKKKTLGIYNIETNKILIKY